MDAVKYIKELKRMCDSYGNSCSNCPIGKEKNLLPCWDYRDAYPEKFVRLVNDWSETHKPITNRKKFLDVFGITLADAVMIPNWLDNEYKEIK